MPNKFLVLIIALTSCVIPDSGDVPVSSGGSRVCSTPTSFRRAKSAPFDDCGDFQPDVFAMNLPISRDVTLGPADPIPSAVVNDIQDQIVGAKRSAWFRPRGPLFTGVGTAGAWDRPKQVTDSLGKTMLASTSIGSGEFGYIELPFDDGDRIIGLTLQGSGNGVTDVTFTLVAFTPSGGISNLGSPTIDNNRTNTWGTFTVSVNPTILTSTQVLYLQALPNATGYNLAAVIPQYDRL